MPLGIPTPPRSVVEHNLADWLARTEFIVPLDDITSTFSTGEFIMENLPENVFLVSLLWRTSAAFVGADSEEGYTVIQFGDTVDYRKFGLLHQGHLGSSNAYGELPLNFEDTSTSGTSLACWVHFENTVPTAGTLELFLKYRAASELAGAGRGQNVRAK